MLVNKVERIPVDLSQVNLNDEWEVLFWCARFSVAPDKLRACVLEVGPRTQDVEARLRKVARESFSMGGED